jgi:hypothetical protein
MTLDLSRIRAARERLSVLARLHPQLTTPEAQERLSDGLPCLLDEEDSMNDETLNLRVPQGTKHRAEALLARIEEIPEVAAALEASKGGIARAPRMSTSLVLRVALLRGLDQLERES